MKKMSLLLPFLALFAISSCGNTQPDVEKPDVPGPVEPDKPTPDPEPEIPKDVIKVKETDKDGFMALVETQAKQIQDTITEANARPYKMDYKYHVETIKSETMFDEPTTAIKEHNVVKTEAIINHNMKKKEIHATSAGLFGAERVYYNIATPDNKEGEKTITKVNGDYIERFVDPNVNTLSNETATHDKFVYVLDQPLQKTTTNDKRNDYYIADDYNSTTTVTNHMMSSVETLAFHSFQVFDLFAPTAEGWVPKYVVTTNETKQTVKYDATWTFDKTVDGVLTKGESIMSILMHGTAIQNLTYSQKVKAKLNENNFQNTISEVSYDVTDYVKEELDFNIDKATKAQTYEKNLPSCNFTFPFYL